VFKGVFHPNDEKWGLGQYPLCVRAYVPRSGLAASQRDWNAHDEVRFTSLLLITRAQIMFDTLALIGRLWNRRRQKVWAAIRSESIYRWPHVLVELWGKNGAK